MKWQEQRWKTVTIVVQENEYQEWKQIETTQLFFKSLFKVREHLKENLIRGSYENEEFVKGKAGALQDLLDMTYEELMEIMNEK